MDAAPGEGAAALAHDEGHAASPKQRGRRNIVVCAQDTPAAAAACEWALHNLYREGDCVHLVYIVKCLLPNMEVFHGLPGTAYSFSQPEEHKEQRLIDDAKRRLEARYMPLLRPKMVPYQLHLYAERCEITEGRVAELIMQDIEQRDASLVVLAAYNRVGAEDREGLGSVAAYLSKNCKRPLVIVRPHLHAQ